MKIQKGFIAQAGFTLIELLVVVSLIGVLATLVIANMNSARERARDAQRKSDLRNIQTGLRLYYNDNGGYPLKAVLDSFWDIEWSDNGVTYMNVLPNDPLAPTQVYTYTYTDSETYTIKACLENKSDDKAVVDATCPSGYKYEVKP
ncbi:MAG: type II secretion system protein [Microgenomates group bacterium]